MTTAGRFLFTATPASVDQQQCVSPTSCTKITSRLRKRLTRSDHDEVSSHRISTSCSSYRSLKQTFLVLSHTNSRTQCRVCRRHSHQWNSTSVVQGDQRTIRRRAALLTLHSHPFLRRRWYRDHHRPFCHQVKARRLSWFLDSELLVCCLQRCHLNVDKTILRHAYFCIRLQPKTKTCTEHSFSRICTIIISFIFQMICPNKHFAYPLTRA